MKPDIKSRRKELNLTLEQVGDLVGVGKSTVRKWETGDIENMKRDKIVKLAKALRVSPSYIMGIEEEQPQIETLPVKKIPVVSRISAGLPIYSEENLIDYIYFATNKLNSDKEEFGLKVSGDSMDKIFQDGDIVVVEKDSIVENGQLGVVMINGYNATVKRIRYKGDQVILIPESNNTNHYPQVYGKDDEVKIIGRVVASQKLF
ncbi:helix-turn-helix domain-containing protein [Staphylococcus epidermidis]|jgi:ORF020|uniref:Helix-turn-helix domain-containing protein n=2 Tax=Bacillati TaxID=1783272 RepID=A0A9X4LFQ8_9STAP|nr:MULTISPECIES: S24 family peptidase [Staphylococcus]DAS97079.1 MAG TPA: SOS-response transcriptional repressors (RecA-mediated autopeptidases) [Caudoviricetes sp.]EHM66641.1 peptidase S24-like protein [Staphylococcus epidermidis VCU071]KAB2194073.1 helix-turn-helix domain-containing protein [Staphylococcus epidermidis]MBC3168125.1 helix-turn-helix domain-containing protein [Staphylococcus epidermidis]MBE0333130.1 helix-turn-helix domain-containing protein [Staphylococcus epidermidis]